MRHRKNVMSTLETGKKIVEKLTGWSRPTKDALAELVRDRDARSLHFKDDGIIPNHPRWPLITYRNVVRLPAELDPAAIFEDLFASNGWGDSWRDGIYDYGHYHSRIHEVLGIARGEGKAQFGGKRGRVVTLRAGDVAILPAGTGHECLQASKDFLVVGAYPPDGTYDECTSSMDYRKAVQTISRVKRPAKDPIFGRAGPLVQLWGKPRHG
jgi:uncharacterized protein YjlB